MEVPKEDVKLEKPIVAPPEGPPPIGGGTPDRDADGEVHHEWLSQRQGWRMTLAALAVPVLLVLGSFGAMLWFALFG